LIAPAGLAPLLVRLKSFRILSPILDKAARVHRNLGAITLKLWPSSSGEKMLAKTTKRLLV